MADEAEIRSSGGRRLEVPADLAGERVDKVVATLLGVSRAVARGLVDSGVTVDGVTVSPSDRVGEGSVVEAPEPVEETMVGEPVDFGVVYEDADMVVVDKPAGLVVHPGAGRTTGTLASGLLHRYPELAGVGAEGRWGLVHRLDKDTSGLMVVARTGEAHRVLSKRLKAREIGRVYLTLAHGNFDAPMGTIDAPIGRDRARPMLRAISHDGKAARTHYEVLARFPDPGCTLLEVRLETGRTHQIRVHLAAIDHPVVGDPVYGRRPQRFNSPRIFLHAHRLHLNHPATDEPMDFVSPLPEDLQGVLDGLAEP
jgi:23S rRNA pseudouridine1911/1915/1917 synthase